MQNFRGTKLSQLGHCVGIHRKAFTFASKQHPQVPQHFEIHGKTFAIQAKTVKVLALKRSVQYTVSDGTRSILGPKEPCIE